MTGLIISQLGLNSAQRNGLFRRRIDSTFTVTISILAFVLAFVPNQAVQAQDQQDGKNRIVISAGDHLQLFEYNPVTSEYEVVWTSPPTGMGFPSVSTLIEDPVLADLDGDGSNELLAVDPYGIFIWGNHGPYPEYYAFKEVASNRSYTQIAVADLDGDGENEIVTQGRWGGRSEDRQIDVWTLTDRTLERIDSRKVNGGTSWALVPWKETGEGSTRVITAGRLIEIYTWESNGGLVPESSFATMSGQNDYVAVADVDGDGLDELMAVGNGGRVTVYKPKQVSGTTENSYPVLFQSTYLHGYTQGLAAGDIDGDDDLELLVGVTSYGDQDHDNIIVYENTVQPTTVRDAMQSTFEKSFGMRLEASGIPGFYTGDTDNDDRTEVLYIANSGSMYVLDFSRDADQQLQAHVRKAFVDKAYGATIGLFNPKGEASPQQTRLVVTSMQLNAVGEERFNTLSSNHDYELWANVFNAWGDTKDVILSVSVEGEAASIIDSERRFESISEGELINNREQPFHLQTADVDSVTAFKLKIVLTARDGFRQTQNVEQVYGREGTSRFDLAAKPTPVVTSETLELVCCEASANTYVFDGLGVIIDRHGANFGMDWPSADHLNKYENLILVDRYNSTFPFLNQKYKTFVEHGGNVFLYGNEVTNGPDDSEEMRRFVTEYLHVIPNSADIKSYQISGLADDRIAGGLDFSLSQLDTNVLPDSLEPIGDAIPIFYYSSGEVAGIRYEGDSKLVYLGFSFEDIESFKVKQELLRRILDWFNED